MYAAPGPQWSSPNESAISLRWLTARLADGLVAGGAIDELWFHIRDEMRRPREQTILFMTDWISDPWIARGVADILTGVAPTWSPPDRLDAWPTFDVDAAIELVGVEACVTRHHAVTSRLASATDPSDAGSSAAIAEFYESEDRIASHGDGQMVLVEHVCAWLLVSSGPLLRAVLVTPESDPGLIIGETIRRLSIPIGYPQRNLRATITEFGDRHLELLLNLTKTADGHIAGLDPADLRVGQGEQWRESWGWLSRRIDAEQAQAAVRLAARLLRNDWVLEALLLALGSPDERLQTLAVGVVRRWILTLRAMIWAEDALERSWREVRPADIACFAFSALRPEWPRRLLAISHRSAEVKPTLATLRNWSSARSGIDATYVPAWETNTGMIWGLFAPTPVLVRVHTPTYDGSEWCRREAEMIDYLVETADFLADRHVIDLELDDVPILELLDDHAAGRSSVTAKRRLPDFPPRVAVWTPMPLPPHENAVLRAAAAIRAMSAFLKDAATVNAAILVLLEEGDLPAPAPTNHPGGWAEYARILRELRALAPDGPEPFALMLPYDYDAAEIAVDDDMYSRIPDLSSGRPALDDVLVAVEFMRTRWPQMVDQRYGRFLALNVRGLTHELWSGHAALGLQRGLLAVRTPAPVWIIQTAVQNVSSWQLAGDPPILTEHFAHQFAWMNEAYVEGDYERAHYADDCGLTVSASLRRLLDPA